jgi:hypothetical protein
MVRRVIALGAFAWLAVLGAPGPAVGQQGPLLWNFDDGLQGWTANGLWDTDGSPGTLLPGQSPPVASAKSPPNSLNYNNGIDYDIGGSAGNATSPVITISQIENFGFQCAYDTETASDDIDLNPQPPRGPSVQNVNDFDLRFVAVLDANNVVVWSRQYLGHDGNDPPDWQGQSDTLTFENCGPRGQWHPHWFPLDPAWGPVRIVFEFQSGLANVGGPGATDAVANEHTGWFIDDVAVTGQFPAPPGGGDGSSRENANGDHSGNDTLGESWCAAGAARSGLVLVVLLAAMAALLGSPSRA